MSLNLLKLASFFTLDIDSCPPHTTIFASQHFMDWYPKATAFKPDPHSILIVVAVTLLGHPAFKAVCLAGFWPINRNMKLKLFAQQLFDHV